MSNLEAMINLQLTRASYISNAYKSMSEEGISRFGVSALETKMKLIETYWEKLENSHEKIVSSGGKIEGLLEMPYFKDGIFDRTLQYYSSIKIQIAQLIEKLELNNTLGSRRSILPGSQNVNATRRALPEISLPKFSGVYGEWRSFRDLFTSLVGSNPDLTNVERMHYLRTSVTGESLKLISNLTVSDESFPIAWEILITRYENKRLLVSAQLDQLLNLPPMTSHSARELNRVLSVVSESLNALNALDCPTESWGPVVVHTIVHRLSPKIREAWENKVGCSTEFPEKSTLIDFLRGRARAMESIELGAASSSQSTAGNSSRNQVKSAKVNAATAGRSSQTQPSQPHIQSTSVSPRSDQRSFPCSHCQGDHFISSCAVFKVLSAAERKQIAERLRLCYNCLGKHSVRDCRTKRTCSICHQKHHTLLHLGSRPAQPSSEVSDAGTSSRNNESAGSL